FKIELLRSAQTGEGSWVSMTVDNHGRLILSPQGKEPMLRVTLKDGKIEQIEPLDVPVTGAMGLLYAFDSLYVNGHGPQGYHFYRLRDTDRNGHFAPPELLCKWNHGRGGDAEHGAHGIVLGPDKKLYIVCGDYGFREGTAKWPVWYPDSLPANVNIGIGSPTGVKFGYAAHYPDDYRAALYIMDWSYGRIMAVHLKEEGATYTGTFENFVAP